MRNIGHSRHLRHLTWTMGLVLGLALGFQSLPAQAGVFALPRLVTPGEFSIGLEPELNFTGTAGLGVNLKYTHGLSELNNLMVVLGSGGGTRNFRVGGALTFDFFPDVEGQPGIGLAVQGMFVQLQTVGAVEITGIPYIHKNIVTSQGEIEPFLGIPIGMNLSGGTYQGLVSIVIGSLFKHSDHLRSVIEFGMSITNATTYVSGGVTYYH